jgi:hypothetical protein
VLVHGLACSLRFSVLGDPACVITLADRPILSSYRARIPPAVDVPTLVRFQTEDCGISEVGRKKQLVESARVGNKRRSPRVVLRSTALGLYAMACQVKPDVTPEKFWETALLTGHSIEVKPGLRTYRLSKIVNPAGLVEALQGRK